MTHPPGLLFGGNLYPGLGDKTTLEVAKVELSVPFKPVSTVY